MTITITIKSSGGLTDDEINNMVNEAESYEKEDQEKLARVEARNKADSLIYQTEKVIKDTGDSIDQNLKTQAEDKIKDLQAILESGSTDQLNKKSEELEQITHQLAQKLYEAKGAQPGAQPGQGGPQFSGAGPQPSQGSDDSDVVDVDYEVTDDEE